MEPVVPGPRDGADPIPNRFDGRAMKAYRCTVGLSRSQVADRASLSRSALKAMERNTIQPSAAAFIRLCKALGLNADEGRDTFCAAPGPADHRPMEFATEAAAADRAEVTTPPGRRRTARLLMLRRGGRDAQ